ncbi:AAA family ATPase [Leifsonia xyli]|uniref:AAA family ATPase n=1 Tax=Leifsonia xyli TaxID=1575 RepID=UPI003D66AF1D
MRINSVTLAGFGPFLDEQHVDFDRFADDGLFLISGRTGAGKSTILDAICFALYGGIPRYDGDTQGSKVRSDHCSADGISEVRLEFTVGDTRYRVCRTPEFERPSKRKGGAELVTEKSTAELAVLVETSWQVTHARAVEVGNALSEIIKLSRGEFQQVILLAQNRFHEFLTAKDDKRQAVLRTLFGTQRFSDYERDLNERRSAAETEKETTARDFNTALKRTADLLGPDTLPTLSTVVESVSVLESAVTVLTGQLTAANGVYERAQQTHQTAALVHSNQERLRRATDELVALNSRRSDVDSLRVIVAAAARVEKVLPYKRDHAAAEAQVAVAEEAEAAARDGFEDTVTAGELADLISGHTRDVGGLLETVALERKLPAMSEAVDAAKEALKQVDARVEALRERQESLPLELAAKRIIHADAQTQAARIPDLEDTVRRHEHAATAGSKAAQLRDELTTALAGEAIAGRSRTEASAALDELRVRRLRGHAAELAVRLQDGSPCEVCGSTTHPAPATSEEKLVTQADIDDAERTFDSAHKKADAATAAVNDLRIAVAAEETKMSGLNAEAIDGLLNAAREDLGDATAASQTAAEASKDITDLEGEIERLSQDLQDLGRERTTATSNVVSAETTYRSAAATVEDHRAGFPTVDARRAALQESIQAAETLLEAINNTVAKRDLAGTAERRFKSELENNGFTNVAELEASTFDTAMQEQHRETIQQFDIDVATTNATLAEPELADLPETAVDLHATESAVADALTARDQIRTEHTKMSAVAEQLRNVVPELQQQAKRLEKLEADYEVIQRLSATVRGDTPNTMRMKLEAFVLAAELEEIVAAANIRLTEMSDGRYELAHTDALRARGAQSGLGLEILDAHTGRARTTQSLSGGETFLASLALALGLAEVVTGRAGGIHLETLFIDEGFGSLDSDTLEIAMGTLDSLRSSGRTVGLISHVETMKEQIPAKLAIDVADGDGV